MATPTYTALATETLTGTDTSITFSSIPATYRDLVLVFDGKGTTTPISVRVRVNGDTGSNYSWVRATGGSAGVLSNSYSTTYLPLIWSNQALGTTQTNGILQLMDYSATDKHKTSLIRENSNNTDGTNTAMYAGRWASTTAINQIEVYVATQNFAAGCTFSLYGIKGEL